MKKDKSNHGNMIKEAQINKDIVEGIWSFEKTGGVPSIKYYMNPK